MAVNVSDRVRAHVQGDFVVFIIGLRINRPWRVTSYLRPMLAMRSMLDELQQIGPDSGLLHVERVGFLTFIQYWRSFDHLESYARDSTRKHRPAWTAFNLQMKRRSGDVGLFHETYLVQGGKYEAVYRGMPPTGLAVAGEQALVNDAADSARQRIYLD
ncbi:monooxygenase family protein [Chthonobacter albigriseus]|uniref:monooxygenase family protein n=1 Tax=Chthonobacter albigriseus TaxID=1683161 RepID=UPI0015EF0401